MCGHGPRGLHVVKALLPEIEIAIGCNLSNQGLHVVKAWCCHKSMAGIHLSRPGLYVVKACAGHELVTAA